MIIRFVIVFAVAATVLGTAGALLAGRLWRRLQRRGHAAVADGRSRGQVWCERVILIGAGLGLLLLGYSFFEPYWPEVTSVRVPGPGLQGSRPLRIVHLSDLHSDARARLEPVLPDMVRELRPDLIVFTGDAVNERRGAKNFRACMRALAGIAPCVAVKGNWDVWWFRDVDLFGGTGVRVLENEAMPLSVAGEEIWVAGVSVDSEAAIPSVLAQVPPARFCLFLHHYPAVAEDAAAGGADLHLAGDTHGGQIRLPWVGALIRMARFGIWMPCGLHQVAGMPVYVNRGIGMEGGAVPRVRFLCRPEITLIEVVPTGKSVAGSARDSSVTE